MSKITLLTYRSLFGFLIVSSAIALTSQNAHAWNSEEQADRLSIRTPAPKTETVLVDKNGGERKQAPGAKAPTKEVEAKGGPGRRW